MNGGEAAAAWAGGRIAAEATGLGRQDARGVHYLVGMMLGAPQRILLATDLSARSDRAMDRAALLMREHDAELLVLHVLEPAVAPERSPWAAVWGAFEPRSSDPRLLPQVREQLATDLRDAGDKVQVQTEEGDPAEVILRVAREHGSDLLVTGVARNEFLGRFTLGKTVDRLLRGPGPSMLIVTNRARGGYRNVVVAVDLSDVSRRTLEAAAALFPDRRLMVFHAFDIPYASLMGNPSANHPQYHQAAHADTTAFVQTTGLPERDRARVDVVVDKGDPERVLQHLVRSSGVDLVVLGTHGRGAIAGALLGSMVKRITIALPCDALVLRD